MSATQPDLRAFGLTEAPRRATHDATLERRRVQRYLTATRPNTTHGTAHARTRCRTCCRDVNCIHHAPHAGLCKPGSHRNPLTTKNCEGP